MAEQEVEKKNRIIYIEPNDVYNIDKDGKSIQLTPPYEDFCISFNLSTQLCSRTRSIDSATTTNEDGEIISLTWVNGDRFRAGFLKGDDFGKNESDENAPTYLTTYYTDISFDNYGTKKIVEGLGVENIQINFESWYTPTIVIKFVDVRGSSLWGNEEAIHESGKITAENVFECFFTQPYPQYRLQIKGFLGKPVTYQLTCSSFKGEYNSQTGNFETVVTFIGYSYSLLTDIPMEYIMAAPYSTWYGIQYWNEHVNDSSWALDNGNPPVKLYELFNTIQSAQENSNDSNEGISVKYNDELKAISTERNILRNIRDSFTSFVSELKRNSYGCIETKDVDEKKHQLLLFFDKGNEEVSNTSEQMNVDLSVSIQTSYEKLMNSVISYNDCFSDRPIKMDNMPNHMNGCPSVITTIRALNIEKENEKITDIKIIGLGTKDKTVTNVMQLKFNNERTLLKETAQRLIDGTTKNNLSDRFKEFCFVFDLYNLNDIVREKIDVIDTREQIIKRKVNDSLETKILEVLTFKPHIGNVFKIIMCHLETLVAIMFQAFTEISDQSRNGLRTSSVLKTPLSCTDIADGYFDKNDKITNKIEALPPWVGVTNQGKVEDSGNYDSANNTLAWVADFSKNYTEEKVVHGLMAAARKIGSKAEPKEKNNESVFFPITISDFNDLSNPFKRIGNSDSLSGLSGVLALRVAQIFGILCDNTISDEIVRTIGKMDAYNYYDYEVTASAVDEIIFKRLGSGENTDKIINIGLCKNECDNYGYRNESSDIVTHKFETVKKVKSAYNKNGRHPVIVDNGKDYIYSSYYDEEGVTIVPSEIKDFIQYKNNIVYYGENDEPYFIPKLVDSVINENNYVANKWQHLCNSSTFIMKFIKNNEVDDEKYVNYDMFNIIVDDNVVDTIEVYYDKIKTNGFNLHEITVNENFTEYIEEFWKITDEYFSKWYDKTILGLNKKDLGIDDNSLFPDDLYGEKGIPKSFGKDISQKFYCNNNNIIKYEDGKYFNLTDDGEKEKNFDELTIRSFDVYTDGKEYGTNIFGHPFYYMQNNIKDGNDRLKVKSLLFLHTLSFNYKDILNVFKPSKKHGIIEAVPYGYLLLLGGLLWRRKQENDPIIFKEEDIFDYYTNGKDYTLLWKLDENTHFKVLSKNYGDSRVKNKIECNISVSELFGYNANPNDYEWLPDLNIQNQLIRLFENFTLNDFSRYSSSFELRNIVSNGILSERKEEIYLHKSITDDVSLMYKMIYTNKLSSDTILERFRNEIASGWQGVYKMITVENTDHKGFIMSFDDKNPLVKECRNLYMKKCIVCDANYRRLNQNDKDKNTEVIIGKNIYYTYVKSFIDTLKVINKNVNENSNDASSEDIADQEKSVRDYELQMYYYLKGLWDKWLIPSPSNRFTVKNFFKNFIFIDSYYRNAYSKLPINCQLLVDIYNGLSKNGSLFTYLNEIISSHHCIFFSLPDYIGFKDNQEEDIETMKDVFRAIPYNKVGNPSDDNKFVIIYTSNFSGIASERSGYKYDGFDIWSTTNKTDVAPSIFKVNKDDIGKDVNDITRMGYNVPSFGVAVNRQNNHIFKSIKVGMDNPVVTEQSIKTYENVTNKGRAGERKIVFHGQDIYNIFSSYSYSCEVEMIGNAQICPLMYFQLLNIPMWRGTYMIYKVNHIMTPGNMVTRFTGMKMSAMPMNFGTRFFTIAGEYNTINERPSGIISGVGSNGGSQGVELNSNYPLITEPNDYWSQRESWQTDAVYEKNTNKEVNDINPNLRHLFNQLFGEIKNLDENKNKPKWNMQITHVLRDGSGTSDHYKGNAMDLQLMVYNENGKPQSRLSGTKKPEILKAVDILFSNHSSQVKQVIIEYNKTEMMKPDTMYNFHVLHVSVAPFDTKSSKHQFYIASHDKKYGSINKGASQDWFLNNVPPEFKQIAKRAFYGDRQFFDQQFNNYQFGGYTESQLKTHFGENDIQPQGNSKFNNCGYSSAGGNVATKNNNPGNIRMNNDKWEGQVESINEFLAFKDMFYGTRAMFKNMNTLIVRGNNTIEALINEWAPSSENNTTEYINFVCQNVGKEPSYRLINIKSDKDVCKAIAKAIAKKEDNIILTDECVNWAYDNACSSIP